MQINLKYEYNPFSRVLFLGLELLPFIIIFVSCPLYKHRPIAYELILSEHPLKIILFGYNGNFFYISWKVHFLFLCSRWMSLWRDLVFNKVLQSIDYLNQYLIISIWNLSNEGLFLISSLFHHQDFLFRHRQVLIIGHA